MNDESRKPYERRDNEFIAWYPNALSATDDAAVWRAPEAAFYIHIPFCDHICEYCGFAVTRRKGSDIDGYLDCLVKEIQRPNTQLHLLTKNFTVGHFGGGTPSVLSAEQLSRVLDAVASVADLRNVNELTLEANPISLTEQKAADYRRLGINRLSLGVQSFNDDSLRAIGRPHRPFEAVKSYEAARRAGFDNISLDLMFGLPGQTAADLEADVSTCIALQPDHVTTFQLERIPLTPLAIKAQLGLSEKRHSDADLFAMQSLILDLFVDAGYVHYGAFNFALPGKQSSHNRIAFIAPQSEYIGWGNGAYSFMNGCVFCNDVSINRYKEAVAAGKSATSYCRKATLLELASRYLVLGLKFLEVPLQPFRELYGADVDAIFGDVIGRLVASGLLARDNESLRLTRNGTFYINNICKEFYVGENQGKRQYLQFEPTISARMINGLVERAGADG